MALTDTTRPARNTSCWILHGKPWTCHAVTQRLLKPRAQIGGLPEDLKMHGMRHTFITRGLMNGVDPRGDDGDQLGIANWRPRRAMHMRNKTEHLEESMTKAVGRKAEA